MDIGPPLGPAEAPEEMLEVAESMRVTRPSEADEDLAREGMSPDAIPRHGTGRGGSWTRKLLVAVIILLLVLSLITGFVVML